MFVERSLDTRTQTDDQFWTAWSRLTRQWNTNLLKNAESYSQMNRCGKRILKFEDEVDLRKSSCFLWFRNCTECNIGNECIPMMMATIVFLPILRYIYLKIETNLKSPSQNSQSLVVTIEYEYSTSGRQYSWNKIALNLESMHASFYSWKKKRRMVFITGQWNWNSILICETLTH